MVAASPAGFGSGINVSMNARNDAQLVGDAVGFVVSTPGNVVAGVPFAVTVTAVDANGAVVPNFLGTVAVSGLPGSQPTSYTFTAADAGSHNMAASATLYAAGPGSVTVTSPFLPNGNGMVNVTAAAAAKFAIVSPAFANAGQSASLTITALDAYGNFARGYTGTVHFSSSDVQAGLPADYTFNSDDGGTHTFDLTLKTAGPQTIRATDANSPAITGISASMAITPAAATSLQVSGGGGYIGSVNAVAISARDAYGNIATGYSGVVHLTSSDPNTSISADAALINGISTFTAMSTTLGTQTLSATDVNDATIAGTESIIVTPGWGVRFVATPLSAAIAGQTQGTTITVYDSFGDISTVYTGTIAIATSDPQAPLAYYTFTAGDAGVHTIPITLKTAGAQSVTISDFVNPGVTVTQTGIQVSPGAAASLSMTSLHGTIAGVAQPLTITARDAYGNIATGYGGTVTFSSSDSQAALPAAYTFTSADAGSHTFSITLKSAGGQSVTVTDLANAGNLAFTKTQADIPITAAAAAGISIRSPSNVTVGVPFSITVSVVDAFGNTIPNYTGKIHFSGPSGNGNLLPLDYTFTAADQGQHVFSITLSSTGTQTIGISDTLNGSIKGSFSVKVVTSPTGGGGGGTTGGGGATGGGGGGGSGGGGKKTITA